MESSSITGSSRYQNQIVINLIKTKQSPQVGDVCFLKLLPGIILHWISVYNCQPTHIYSDQVIMGKSRRHSRKIFRFFTCFSDKSGELSSDDIITSSPFPSSDSSSKVKDTQGSKGHLRVRCNSTGSMVLGSSSTANHTTSCNITPLLPSNSADCDKNGGVHPTCISSSSSRKATVSVTQIYNTLQII